MKAKKLRRGDPLVAELCINKQLEKYGLSIDNIMDYQEYNGVPWYQHFTFDSEDEFEQWKGYCIDLLIHGVTPKYTLKSAKTEFSWFNLMYGLKCSYL